MTPRPFPFPAIVGLEAAKRSLLFHAVDPLLGGALLIGHRGCAKTTLVRAFADLLRITDGDTHRLTEVPLGATEDRLLGGVDPQRLTAEGTWLHAPGLIQEANGGVLYVDEINLLPDHLADHLLDAAATGSYRLQRDGFSKVIESRFILAGTMNPDEGELRPQLQDRFAHAVRLHDHFSEAERVAILERRMQFDDDPAGFCEGWNPALQELAAQIAQARRLLKEVRVRDEDRRAIAQEGIRRRYDSMRLELSVLRTARCAAAWNGRREILPEDLEEAWTLCSEHRPAAQSGNPPQPPPPPAPPSRGPAPQSSPSLSPLQSRETSANLETPQPVSTIALEKLLPPEPGMPQGHGPSSSTRRGAPAMSDSLTASWAMGWRPGAHGFRLRFHRIIPRPNFLIFVDASRSSGASGFLSQVRKWLSHHLPQFTATRLSLLRLHGGCNEWLLRRAGVSALQEIGRLLTCGSGKSLISDGIRLLRRTATRLRTPVRTLIFSDACQTPFPGETTAQTRKRLAAQIQVLARNQSALLWFHPASQNEALSRHIHRLAEETHISFVPIRLNA